MFVDESSLAAAAPARPLDDMQRLIAWTVDALKTMLEATKADNVAAREQLLAVQDFWRSSRARAEEAEAATVEMESTELAAAKAAEAAAQAHHDELLREVEGVAERLSRAKQALEEQRVTKQAKQEMVRSMHQVWSQRAVSCSTKVSLPEAGDGAERTSNAERPSAGRLTAASAVVGTHSLSEFKSETAYASQNGRAFIAADKLNTEDRGDVDHEQAGVMYESPNILLDYMA